MDRIERKLYGIRLSARLMGAKCPRQVVGQFVKDLDGMQEVNGSTPLSSTI